MEHMPAAAPVAALATHSNDEEQGREQSSEAAGFDATPSWWFDATPSGGGLGFDATLEDLLSTVVRFHCIALYGPVGGERF